METNIPRPEYPRPQFFRKDWINLNGSWTYEFDPGKSGLERGLNSSTGFNSKIMVPFCPESKLSGVGHTDFIEAMFYHKLLEIPAAWAEKRVILHFGAVDYSCEAFINGKSVGSHYGGTVSFEFDITDFVEPGKSANLVLAVKDELRSQTQGGGKQCPKYKSYACCYTRTTGIWQTVWMEQVAKSGLKSCRVTPDLDAGTFCFVPKFYQTKSGDKLIIRISSFGQLVGSAECAANEGMPVIVKLSEIHPWSPEDPFLYDIEYFVVDSSGCRIDTVYGYAGLRKVHVEGGKYYLNNKPVFLRFVLDQGFYPDGIWTAPSDEALKRDIQLSMAAGFNGARLHQKVFEERFHYWADKLGYLTWGESSSWGLQFCGGIYDNHLGWKSAYNFLTEWKQIIERDYNHPSIITWTPLNETWPGSDMRLYNYVISEIYDTTKYLDPIRPCNDCSGYSHAKTDLWTVHFYAKDAEHLSTMLNPKDKPVFMKDHENCYHGQPYIVDEFGGLMFIAPDRQKFADNTWGYYGIQLKNEDELCAKIDEQVDVMIQMENVVGYCYTQLTDVEQEQNGVYYYDRTPKVSEGKLQKIFGKVPDWAK